jgi:hypothetical protein
MALSIEKKIHIHSKKSIGKTPLDKRLNYIKKLLEEDEYKLNGIKFIIL